MGGPAPVPVDRQEARKRSKRGEVFGLVCFRYGLRPADLAALPADAIARCFRDTTGRDADKATLAKAAVEYAESRQGGGDAPYMLTSRAADPARLSPPPAPHRAAADSPAAAGPAVPLRLDTTTRLELLAEACRARGIFVPVWPATVGVTCPKD